MMRYQRVSPDCLGLPNGRKPSSIRTTSSSCKDDDAYTSAGRISNYPPFDAKPLRVRSGSASGSTNPLSSTTQTQEDHNSNTHPFPHFPSSSDSVPPPENPKTHEINGRCSGGAAGGGDVLLQWGHNKRSRGSRAENRTVGDESSIHSRQHVKIQRRAAIAGAERIAAAAAASAMPPPCSGGYTRGANLRASMPLRDSTGSHHNRTVEDRSGGHSRSEKRSPPSPPERANHHHHHKTAAAAVTNGFGSDMSLSTNHHHPESSKHASDQDTVGSGSGGGATAAAAQEKVSLEQFEWPRIYLSLSRKEKEDDFLAMKGTKLPQRPKKRAKNIDKSLQYCFPGMWLSDLTRGRYEVREKKSVKKKRRGLKGMESMESDSE